jgi:hypothetical protein
LITTKLYKIVLGHKSYIDRYKGYSPLHPKINRW